MIPYKQSDFKKRHGLSSDDEMSIKNKAYASTLGILLLSSAAIGFALYILGLL